MASICVFTGSRDGRRPAYVDAATALGEEIAHRGLRLVYGGGRVGLMGAIADAALAAGGEVAGVIPRSLVDAEVAHPGLTELHVTGSMHERKATMADLSDAVVALPGGLGTLDELFESLTWTQLGLHALPCGLLDVEDYWAPLVRLLDHAVAEGFVAPASRGLLRRETSAPRLLDLLGAG